MLLRQHTKDTPLIYTRTRCMLLDPHRHWHHFPHPLEIEKKQSRSQTVINSFKLCIFYGFGFILTLFEKATKSLSDKELLKVCFPSRLSIFSLSLTRIQPQAVAIYDGSSSRWNNRHAIHFEYRYVSCWEIEKDEMSYFTFCDFNGI